MKNLKTSCYELIIRQVDWQDKQQLEWLAMMYVMTHVMGPIRGLVEWQVLEHVWFQIDLNFEGVEHFR